MAAAIRERQAAALRRMLNFNEVVSDPKGTEPSWKILIYDKHGQDIIAPLYDVKELHDMGVTLHLTIDTDRGPIPDVPAIYFVMPTDQNVERICKDMREQLYGSYYFNFITAIPRAKLEELAQTAIQADCVAQVARVYDQYLNFISLEEDLFVLKHCDSEIISYYAMNRGDVKDTDIEQIIDMIVDGLFSAFVTLGTVPIIRCPRGNNAAQMVAEKLDKKMRDNLRDARSSLFVGEGFSSGQLSFQRPLLVILDRTTDMVTPLHHTWTYQALAHDVLSLSLNSIELEIKETTGATSPHRMPPKREKKSYIMSVRDKFWQNHKGSPFPIVAESIQEELESYKSSEEDVKRLKADMGFEDDQADQAMSMLVDNTAKLTSAMSSLPELLAKKKLLDMHTNISFGLLHEIKARKLDIYFETEEKIMGKTTLDKQVIDIINDPDAGSPEDKLRLFMIYYICTPKMTDSELDQYLTALQAAKCDVNPVKYIKRWKNYAKLAMSQYGDAGTKTVSMFSKLMTHASQFAMEGVKNLVVKKHKLPVTRVMDNLMELKASPDTDEYKFYDPKVSGRVVDKVQSMPRQPFQEAIVFVVGGGNYIEYQNLLEYVKEKQQKAPRKITYGCTNLCSASQFLHELSKLGAEVV